MQLYKTNITGLFPAIMRGIHQERGRDKKKKTNKKKGRFVYLLIHKGNKTDERKSFINATNKVSYVSL